MDNNKKLFEGLLKADGIDPAGVTESDRIAFGKMLDKQSKQKPSKPGNARPDIWRIIMKNGITKYAAAAVIVIAVLLSITFLDKSVTPAYAIEQTIEALSSIRFIHLVHRDQTGMITDERWIELGSNLEQLRYYQKSLPDFLAVEDGTTVAMYRNEKNTVVLYHPKDKRFTIGPIGQFLKSLSNQRLIIDENVEYRGKRAHRVSSLMANQDIYVDTETFLPIAGAGLEISYETPPEGIFEVVIPDGFVVVDKRPGVELGAIPDWFKEYEAADENFKKAKQALREDEFQMAVSLFENVVNNQPQRNWAWYWMGRGYYELGEYDRAIYAFTKLYDIIGSWSYCHYSRALAYMQKDMQLAAEEDLDKALPWMILSLRYPEGTTMFEIADTPFGGQPFQASDEEARSRMINRLREATGQDFGYDHQGTAEDNEQALSAWEKYVSE